MIALQGCQMWGVRFGQKWAFIRTGFWQTKICWKRGRHAGCLQKLLQFYLIFWLISEVSLCEKIFWTKIFSQYFFCGVSEHGQRGYVLQSVLTIWAPQTRTVEGRYGRRRRPGKKRVKFWSFHFLSKILGKIFCPENFLTSADLGDQSKYEVKLKQFLEAPLMTPPF